MRERGREGREEKEEVEEKEKGRRGREGERERERKSDKEREDHKVVGARIFKLNEVVFVKWSLLLLLQSSQLFIFAEKKKTSFSFEVRKENIAFCKPFSELLFLKNIYTSWKVNFRTLFLRTYYNIICAKDLRVKI